MRLAACSRVSTCQARETVAPRAIWPGAQRDLAGGVVRACGAPGLRGAANCKGGLRTQHGRRGADRWPPPPRPVSPPRPRRPHNRRRTALWAWSSCGDVGQLLYAFSMHCGSRLPCAPAACLILEGSLTHGGGVVAGTQRMWARGRAWRARWAVRWAGGRAGGQATIAAADVASGHAGRRCQGSACVTHSPERV